MAGTRYVGGIAVGAAALFLAGSPDSEAIKEVPSRSITGLSVTGIPPVVDSGNTRPQPLAGGGDVNGDGQGDVLVGSPAEGPMGRREAGAAYVVFGGGGRRQVDVRRVGSAGYRLEGASPTLPVELDDHGPAGERAGSSLATVGDVNGDGIGDLAVGAPRSSAGGRPLAGAVHVVFGSRPGSGVDLGALGARGYRIDGASASGLAGSHVAGAGDANGDGLADVVVSGKRGAWIAFGKRGTEPVNLQAPGTKALVIRPERGKNNEGTTVEDFPVSGAGDFNGDGLSDVVVGAPDLTPRDRYRAGAAYVVFGRREAGEVLLDRLGGGGFRIDGEDSQGFAGTSVAAAGDVNGDGLADVLVGAPDLGADGSDESADYGAAYVVLGRRVPVRVDLGPRRGRSVMRIVGDPAEADAELGSGIAGIGDVNGDGLDEVAIGAPGWDADCRRDTGATFVVRGRRVAASIRLQRSARGVYRLDGAARDAGLGQTLAPLFRKGQRGAALLAGSRPSAAKRPPAAPRVLDTALPHGARRALPQRECLKATLLASRSSTILRTGGLPVRLRVAVPTRGAVYSVQAAAIVGRREEFELLGSKAGRIRGRSTTVRLRLTRRGRRLLERRPAQRVVLFAYLDVGADEARQAFSLTRLRR